MLAETIFAAITVVAERAITTGIDIALKSDEVMWGLTVIKAIAALSLGTLAISKFLDGDMVAARDLGFIALPSATGVIFDLIATTDSWQQLARGITRGG